MMKINESGMTFGPYDESVVYYIEKSRLFNSVKNVKTVEFILNQNSKALFFVEAKSSSPQPNSPNGERFDEFICEISEKFVHSLNLYYSAVLERHMDESDIPSAFSNLRNSELSLKLILVINGHQAEWLVPIQEGLYKNMKPYEAIWKFEIAVLNDSMAKEYKLIS